MNATADTHGSAGGPTAGADRLRLAPISLPKGGGAIRGIGETVRVNAATGSGSVTVPIATSPGRDGFGPQLALSYDSAVGNSPFGLGWSLDVPEVTRRTDRGLPRYDDHDTFVLSGAEELVPADGPPVDRRVWGRDFRVRCYRPRTEGLYARIELWTDRADGTTLWRTITRDNVTSLYGLDDTARVSDTADPRRVFAWRLSQTFDGRGHLVVYVHRAEDGAGLETAPTAGCAQRYLAAVRYGYRGPYQPGWDQPHRPAPPESWMFELVVDHGEGDPRVPRPQPTGTWPVRPDPFSTYRAGFEIRTCRRVHRLLMFHHFPDVPQVGRDCLVRSTDLTYRDETIAEPATSPGYSHLAAVTVCGYRRDGTGYRRATMPPLEFRYSDVPATDHPGGSIPLDARSARHLPTGLRGPVRMVDLDGDGAGGLLTLTPGGWAYLPNVSPANLADGRRTARFGAPRPLPALPTVSWTAPLRFTDLAGDGRLDVVCGPPGQPGLSGFFERRADGPGWEPFRAFRSVPVVDDADPNLTQVDLTGDGLADLLITEGDAVACHLSLGEDGYAARVTVPAAGDPTRGPRVLLADGDRRRLVTTADMSGDGLADLVQVDPSGVCYWPNLGYGRFGAKVTMGRPAGLPVDDLDPGRVRLADIDGTGTADLVYVYGDGRLCGWANRSGNGWAAPRLLATFPTGTDPAGVQVVDLLAAGTACAVWSTQDPARDGAALRYVDLMPGGKPHLLTGVDNNLGGATVIRYIPATSFAVTDALAGRPWVSRLPFPVHVVTRVETIDRVSRCRYVTRYAYHHGHFDGAEREFRGFGLVETWDTADRSTAIPAGDDDRGWRPPVHVRTWYHTGTGPEAVTAAARDYWTDTAADLSLPAPLLPADLDPAERPEAYRALRGHVLRVEVRSADAGPSAHVPHQVSEYTYRVRRLQRGTTARHAVFAVDELESVTVDLEREPADPRIRHQLTLEVDDHGNPVRTLTVDYPRRPGRQPPAPQPPEPYAAALRHDQSRPYACGTWQRYTAALSTADTHRTPLPADTVTAELVGLQPPADVAAGRRLWRRQELAAYWAAAWQRDLPAEGADTARIAGLPAAQQDPGRRVLTWTLTRYRADTLTGLLPVGECGGLALPGESYRLAMTPALLHHVLADAAGPDDLAAAGYVRIDPIDPPLGSGVAGGWWLPDGRTYLSPGDDDPATELGFARAHYFRPRRAVNPFGALTRVEFDADDLLPTAATDPVGNVTRAEPDYRLLQPSAVVDPNGNRSEVAADTLGLTVGLATMGTADRPTGDTLDGFVADLDEAARLAYLAQPLANPASVLGDATTRIVYDLDAYRRSTRDGGPARPATVASVTRCRHVAEPDGAPAYQHALTFTDGLGRELQRKAPAEPDPADPDTARWIASAWTVRDNKDDPFLIFEPFFTTSAEYEPDSAAGDPTVLFRDPMGRQVAVLHPDHTWEKTVVGGWHLAHWDAVDTLVRAGADGAPAGADPRQDDDVGAYFTRYLGTAPPAFTSWYDKRIDGQYPGRRPQDERDAAVKAAAHAATPTVVHLDPAGRTCLTVEDAGGDTDRYHCTRTALDGQGRPLAVVDPLGRRAVAYCLAVPGPDGVVGYLTGHDLAGRTLYRTDLDAGARRTLPDAAGRPWRAWTSRQHRFTWWYDPAGRTTHLWCTTGNGPARLIERRVHGEAHPQTAERNLRGRSWRVYDGAGLVETGEYDVDGNPTHTIRHLAADHHGAVDWSGLPAHDEPAALDVAAAPLLRPDGHYTGSTRYDTLGRPVQVVTPHNPPETLGDPRALPPSVLRHHYGPSGMLRAVDVWVRRPDPPDGLLDPATADLHVLTGVRYNAFGQREQVEYGNGTVTEYDYDPHTRRLRRLLTQRLTAPAPERTVQDLSYAYDPAGNITHLHDDADPQGVVFFRNQRVGPSRDYEYDARYRLTVARGREHVGQTGAAPTPYGPGDDRAGLPHPGDGNAMARYVETYAYDAADNLTTVGHRGAWTRDYRYEVPSCIEPGTTSNRLSGIDTHGGWEYDEHGNPTQMPHLSELGWDEQDRLCRSVRQAVGPGVGTPETTYYGYDAGGARVRKTTDSFAPAAATPATARDRIYLGPVELECELDPGGVRVQRETLHIEADGRRLALVETRSVGSDPGPARLVRYQYADHLGCAVLELDDSAAAQIISYEEYSPYGSTTYQAVRSQTETPKRYRYTGREHDPETGMRHHGARYYLPWAGRWANPDPLADDEGNGFAFCCDNPVRFIDPSGRQGETAHLIESIRIQTIATRTEFATRDTIRAYVSNLAHSWMENPADYDIGHAAETPHYSSPAGTAQTVHPQHWASNARQSVQERAAAQQIRGRNAELRASGAEGPLEFVRENRVDVTAAKGKRYALQLPKKLVETARKYSRAAVDAARKAYQGRHDALLAKLGKAKPAAPPAAPAPVQLSLPFKGGSPATPPTLPAAAPAAEATPLVSKAGRVLAVAGKGIEVGGAVLGAATGGWQVGTGIQEIAEGRTAEGAVSVAEGGTTLGMSIAVPAAVKGGLIVAGGGTLAVAGATLAAAAGVGLAAESVRAAVRGEKTPVERFDAWTGTHLGDIYGWVTGAYSRR